MTPSFPSFASFSKGRNRGERSPATKTNDTSAINEIHLNGSERVGWPCADESNHGGVCYEWWWPACICGARFPRTERHSNCHNDAYWSLAVDRYDVLYYFIRNEYVVYVSVFFSFFYFNLSRPHGQHTNELDFKCTKHV